MTLLARHCLALLPGALVLALTLATGLGAVLTRAAPPPGQPVLVLVLAHGAGGAAALVHATGGRVLPAPAAGPLGRLGIAALAVSTQPGFADDLRAAGALAVLDPGTLAGVCAAPVPARLAPGDGAGAAHPAGRPSSAGPNRGERA